MQTDETPKKHLSCSPVQDVGTPQNNKSVASKSKQASHSPDSGHRQNPESMLDQDTKKRLKVLQKNRAKLRTEKMQREV